MTLPYIDVEAFPLSSVDDNPSPLVRGRCVDSCESTPGEKGEENNPTLEFFKEMRGKIEDAGAGHCIFISGGSDINSGWVVPVPIKNPEDDVATWRQIQHSWYKSTRSWKRHLPFYRITAVEEVKISFEGKRGHKYSVSVVESLDESDIDLMLRQLHDEKDCNDSWVGHLEDYETVDWPYPCYFDPTSGRYKHINTSCPTQYDVECPYEIRDKLNDRQNRLNTLHLLMSCFQTPEIATGQRTLEGFVMEESFVYPCTDLDYGSGYRPRIGGICFIALRIQEGFLIPSKSYVIYMMIAAGMLIIWGICTTDWKTSLQAGVAILAAIMSAPAGAQQYESTKESIRPERRNSRICE